MFMLVRKFNEEINIGDDVVVKVLVAKGDHVKIGIDVPVHRDVIHKKIQAEISCNR